VLDVAELTKEEEESNAVKDQNVSDVSDTSV
jgi:hypothetical protein